MKIYFQTVLFIEPLRLVAAFTPPKPCIRPRLNLPERKDAILLVLICTGRHHAKIPDSTDL
jgi:hypothetical protein